MACGGGLMDQCHAVGAARVRWVSVRQQGRQRDMVWREMAGAAQQEPADHSSAYADHSAAIESASTVQEWQDAYTTAWQWAETTGSDEIKKDIKQLAGEVKKKLTQQ